MLALDDLCSSACISAHWEVNSVFPTAFFMFALNALLCFPWPASGNSWWTRAEWCLCVGLLPAQAPSSHMCRGYHPGLNFVLAFGCDKCCRINMTAVNETAGHQCLFLKWKLAVGGEIRFLLLHNVEARDLLRLLCFALQSCWAAFSWMNWWREVGRSSVWSLMLCGARAVQDAAQCNAVQ